MEISIEKMMADPNNFYDIHRTHLGINNSNEIQSSNFDNIINNGLVVTGQINQGAISNKILPLTQYFSPLYGLSGYINLISNYKDNDVIIIYKFSNQIVDKDLNVINDRLYENLFNYDNGYYLNPEFIECVIIKKEDEFRIINKSDLLNYKNKNERM